MGVSLDMSMVCRWFGSVMITEARCLPNFFRPADKQAVALPDSRTGKIPALFHYNHIKDMTLTSTVTLGGNPVQVSGKFLQRVISPLPSRSSVPTSPTFL